MPLSWPGSLSWPASLFNISLPAGLSLAGLYDTRNWQRRLLVYLIRRALGGVFELPEDSIEQSTHLHADLGSGHVKLSNVKLDVPAVNARIQEQLHKDVSFPVDIELLSGDIDQVQLLVGADASNDMHTERTMSVTERLFSAPIRLSADELFIKLRVRPRTEQPSSGFDKGKDRQRERSDDIEHGMDLSASIFGLAEDYVQDVSSASAHSDDAAEEDDPFSLPGAFSVQPAAGSAGSPEISEQNQVGVIATIIQRILARLHISAKSLRLSIELSDSTRAEGMQLEFRLGSAESSTSIEEGSKGVSYVRNLSVVEPSLFMRLAAASQETTRAQSTEQYTPTSSASSSSSSEGCGESTGSSDDMAMSMAIADLRTSATGTTLVPAASATGMEKSIYHDMPSEYIDSPPSAAAESSQPEVKIEHQEPAEWTQVMGLFPPVSSRCAPGSLTGRFSNSGNSAQLDVQLPTLAILLLPKHIRCLVGFLGQLHGPRNASPAPPDKGKKGSASHGVSCLSHFLIGSLQVFIPMAQSDVPLHDFLFSTATLSCDTLHLTVDRAEGAYRSPSGDGKVTVKNYSIALRAPAPAGPRTQPILLPDPGLAWSYSLASMRPSHSIPHKGDWQENPGSSHHDSWQDWQTAVPSGASSLTAESKMPLLGDAVALRSSQNGIKIILQPVHVWLDFAVLQKLVAFQEVLDLASTRQTKRHAPDGPSQDVPSASAELTISIACVRIGVRCPNPGNGRLRSGIFTLDVHDLRITKPASQGVETSSAHQPTKANGAPGGSKVDPALLVGEVGAIALFLNTAISQAKFQSVCFVCIPASAGGTTDVRLTRQSQLASQPVLRVMCSLPTIQAYFDKPLLDGLQYLADDLGQSATAPSDKATSAGNSDSPVSSRSSDKRQQQSSIGTVVSDSSDDSGLAPLKTVVAGMDIGIEGIYIVARTADFPSKAQRDMKLTAKDVRLDAELRQNGRDDLLLTVSSKSMTLREVCGLYDRLLLRRLGPSALPCLQLSIVSANDSATQSKHSRVKVALSSLLYNLSPENEWITDLAALLKAPEGAFTNVVPTDTTKVELALRNSMLRLHSSRRPSALAFEMRDLRYSIKLVHGQQTTRSSVKCLDFHFWLADNADSGKEGDASLKSLGYASLATVDSLSAGIEQSTLHGVPTLDVSIQPVKAVLTTCPDTVTVLTELLGDFSKPVAPRSMPPVNALADLSGSILHARPSSVGDAWTSVQARGTGKVIDDADGDTIRVFSSDSLEFDETWFARKLATTETAPKETSVLRVRLQPSDISISLFEGYDFERSRRYVKDTVKATRKKLEKIRQLLADGQVPDETVEEAADHLLQSVFFPLRPAQDVKESNDGGDRIDRIVAFDDQLDRDDVSTYSWETLPSRPHMQRTASTSSTKQRASKLGRLKRPRTSALDLQLTGFAATFNQYNPSSSTASRVHVAISSVTVVDNLPTSTWNKLLTELRPRDGGVVRPTGSPMIKAGLKMVRSEHGMGDEEAVLKIKVAPLRLHVDQDALDFLKAFGAFKMDSSPTRPAPAVPSASATSGQSGGGFVQRVEIFPIKIKLDYKPKRVDYHALRQGRTIEMMNFFSFEASEMTLRHVVLSGVPSWAKVGDLLQDIWTPDVKANQLADFLAGINPVRSVVNVGAGVSDLVLLPIQQYKRDGRVSRGVQKGTASFAKTTALEAIKLGARLATGTQVILEHAEHVLGGRLPDRAGPGGSEVVLDPFDDNEEEEEGEPGHSAARDRVSKFSQQPSNVREGIDLAYKSLSGNIKSAAETILAVPMEVYERSNDGPARTVVKAVPIAVLRPMIGASEAVSKTLLGLRNTLDPGVREENEDKYKKASASMPRSTG